VLKGEEGWGGMHFRDQEGEGGEGSQLLVQCQYQKNRGSRTESYEAEGNEKIIPADAPLRPCADVDARRDGYKRQGEERNGKAKVDTREMGGAGRDGDERLGGHRRQPTREVPREVQIWVVHLSGGAAPGSDRVHVQVGIARA